MISRQAVSRFKVEAQGTCMYECTILCWLNNATILII